MGWAIALAAGTSCDAWLPMAPPAPPIASTAARPLGPLPAASHVPPPAEAGALAVPAPAPAPVIPASVRPHPPTAATQPASATSVVGDGEADIASVGPAARLAATLRAFSISPPLIDSNTTYIYAPEAIVFTPPAAAAAGAGRADELRAASAFDAREAGATAVGGVQATDARAIAVRRDAVLSPPGEAAHPTVVVVPFANTVTEVVGRTQDVCTATEEGTAFVRSTVEVGQAERRGKAARVRGALSASRFVFVFVFFLIFFLICKFCSAIGAFVSLKSTLGDSMSDYSGERCAQGVPVLQDRTQVTLLEMKCSAPRVFATLPEDASDPYMLPAGASDCTESTCACAAGEGSGDDRVVVRGGRWRAGVPRGWWTSVADQLAAAASASACATAAAPGAAPVNVTAY